MAYDANVDYILKKFSNDKHIYFNNKRNVALEWVLDMFNANYSRISSIQHEIKVVINMVWVKTWHVLQPGVILDNCYLWNDI